MKNTLSNNKSRFLSILVTLAAILSPIAVHAQASYLFASVKKPDRDKPRQGLVASSLKLPRSGAVGFIDRLVEIGSANVTTALPF